MHVGSSPSSGAMLLLYDKSLRDGSLACFVRDTWLEPVGCLEEPFPPAIRLIDAGEWCLVVEVFAEELHGDEYSHVLTRSGEVGSVLMANLKRL